MVLWESGRGILEGSLEEVGFKGLDLESKKFAPALLRAVLPLTSAWQMELLGVQTGDPAARPDGSSGAPQPRRAGPQPCQTQSWPWACPSRPTA